MRQCRGRIAVSMLAAALTLFAAAAAPVLAQDPGTAGAVTLYADRHGQLFNQPGRGRVKVGTYVPLATADQLEHKLEAKTQEQIKANTEVLRTEFDKQMAQQKQWNTDVGKQVSEMQPAWREFGDRWFKKISLGVLVYGDWRYMTHTGFGPQFLTQMMWPGPGNNNYNAFDITRAYLDFKFSPNDDFTLRVTPNVYTTVGSASADSVGRSTSWGSTLDGNLGFRLKYAYIDYQTFFKKLMPVDSMKDDKFTFGQQQNPLVDWEENLYGFRYVNLVPWNYISLSSTQVGLSMKGPIKCHEMQYADYDFGVYNDASFHATQQANQPQLMGRVTINPLGAKSRYDSLGLTAFYDYAWANKAVDNQFTGINGIDPVSGKMLTGVNAANSHSTRVAMLLHYTAEHWGLAGEWDYGFNAASSGNLFSGAGPIDQISGKTSSFKEFNGMVSILQNNGRAVQQGFDLFGHADIPQTPFTLFGMFEEFLPNTRVDKNPMDFQRYIVGLQYMVNKNLRFALDTQNITYFHDQFTFPGMELSKFAGKSESDVPYAVPRDVHAFMLNMQFSY
jgi:hypothetical protein